MSGSIGRLASIEFTGRLIGRFSQYGITFVVARALGADGLGTFAFAFVALQLSGAAARGGFDTAMLKFVPIDRDDPHRLTGTVLIALFGTTVLAIFLLFILFVAGGVVPAAKRFHPTKPAGLMLVGLPLFSLIRVTEATTRGFDETKYAVYIREFGMRAVGLVLITIVVFVVGTVESVIAAFLFALIISVSAGIIFLFRLGAFSGLRSPNFEVRRIVSYALPVAGVAIANPMIIWTDILMLGVLRESASIGLYRVAYQTAALLTFALVSVNAIFPSIASRLYNQGEIEELSRTYSTVTLFITSLTLFSAVFIIIFSSEILAIFGSEFAAAQTVLIILAASRIVDAGVGPAGFLLSMTGNERIELLNTVAVAGVNLALNYILILRFGIIGAAVATTVSLSLLNILRAAEIYSLFSILPQTRRSVNILPPILLGGSLMFLFWSLKIPSIQKLIFAASSSFIIFAGSFWAIVVNEQDVELLIS